MTFIIKRRFLISTEYSSYKHRCNQLITNELVINLFSPYSEIHLEHTIVTAEVSDLLNPFLIRPIFLFQIWIRQVLSPVIGVHW